MDKILLFLGISMIACCLAMLYSAIRIYMIDREINRLVEKHDALQEAHE